MSDIFGIGSIVSAGMNLFGAERGFDVSRDMQEDEQEFNAEQAQLNRDWQTAERIAQNEWNLAQWERNNQYNSLDSQIKRALAAGVNPNAIIGGSIGQVASAPQGSNIGSGAQAQTPSIAAQALDTYASMPDGIVGGINGIIDAALKDVDYEYSGKVYEKRLAEYDAHIAEIGSRKGLNEAQIKNLEEQTRWLPKLNDAKIKEVNSLITKYNAEVINLGAQKELIDAQRDTEKYKQNLLEEQAFTEQIKQDDLAASADLKDAQEDYYRGQTELVEENVIKEQFLNEFRDVTGLDPNMSIVPAVASLVKNDKLGTKDFFEAASLIFGFTFAGKLGKAAKGFKGLKSVPKFLKKLFTNKSAKPGVDDWESLGFGGAH